MQKIIVAQEKLKVAMQEASQCEAALLAANAARKAATAALDSALIEFARASGNATAIRYKGTLYVRDYGNNWPYYTWVPAQEFTAAESPPSDAQVEGQP